MACLQQDLVVENFPLRVITDGNRELCYTGNQVLGDSGLVDLLSAQHVFQLQVDNICEYMITIKQQTIGSSLRGWGGGRNLTDLCMSPKHATSQTSPNGK